MFRFENPNFLYAFALLPLLLLVFAIYLRWRQKALRRFAIPELQRELAPSASIGRHRLKMGLFLAALVFLVIALANPQLGTKRERITQQGLDVFLALDISNSMLCEDVAPNRLEQARRFAVRCVQALRGNRIGLLLFAGDAFLAVPLTTDYNALLNSLETSHPALAGVQGTDLAQAFKLARLSFLADDKTSKAIILITDGEDHEGQAAAEMQLAAEAGMVTFAVGVGTAAGGFIPIETNGRMDFLRDPATGQPVRTRFQADLLREMSRQGNGAYFSVSGDVEALARKIETMEKQKLEVRNFSEYASYFPWFVGLGLLLLVVEFVLPFGKHTPDTNAALR